MQETSVPTDGRAARAARTRDAIVEATVSLVEDGDLRPTAPRIAERAGVSVRSVFQHFDDLPALHTAVVQRVVERLAVLVAAVDPGLPRPERIDAFAANRAVLLEAVTPFRRAAAVHAPFAPELRDAVARGGAYLREEVEQVFGPELDQLDEGERGQVLDALTAGSSWGVWDGLRTDAGDTPAQAQAVVVRLVTAVLDSISPRS